MPATAQRYLLDTNILVHYVRRSKLGEWVEATYSLESTPTPPLISAVTEGEVRSLALQWHWGKAKIEAMEELLGYFVSVPLDQPGIYAAYADIDYFSRSTGREVGSKNDVWIAATAHVANARLLTTDKDFDHLDPLYLTRDWFDPDAAY